MVAEGKPCKDILTDRRPGCAPQCWKPHPESAMSCLENALLTQDKEKPLRSLPGPLKALSVLQTEFIAFWPHPSIVLFNLFANRQDIL